MLYTRRIAAEKRKETMEARKRDTGCTCHGLPLLQCPNHDRKPVAAEITRLYVERVILLRRQQGLTA